MRSLWLERFDGSQWNLGQIKPFQQQGLTQMQNIITTSQDLYTL